MSQRQRVLIGSRCVLCIMMVTNAWWEVTQVLWAWTRKSIWVVLECIWLFWSLCERLLLNQWAFLLVARGAGLFWSAENCIIWHGNEVAKSTLPDATHSTITTTWFSCVAMASPLLASARLVVTHHCCNGLVWLECGNVKRHFQTDGFFSNAPLSLTPSTSCLAFVQSAPSLAWRREVVTSGLEPNDNGSAQTFAWQKMACGLLMISVVIATPFMLYPLNGGLNERAPHMDGREYTDTWKLEI